MSQNGFPDGFQDFYKDEVIHQKWTALRNSETSKNNFIVILASDRIR